MKRALNRLKTPPPLWARIVQIVSTVLAIIVREWESIPAEWKAAIPGDEIKPLIYIFIIVAVVCQYPNKKSKENGSI